MYVTLYPDEYTDTVQPVARQAADLIGRIAGLGDAAVIDEDVDVVDGSRNAVTAIVALVELAYDPIGHPGADLARFLRDVAAIIDESEGDDTPTWATPGAAPDAGSLNGSPPPWTERPSGPPTGQRSARAWLADHPASQQFSPQPVERARMTRRPR